MNEEYFLYLDAKNGARKELAKLRKLEKATQNEEIINQANRIRKRISIYSQKLIDIKKDSGRQA